MSEFNSNLEQRQGDFSSQFHEQLTAAYDLLRAEVEEQVAALDSLALQLHGLQSILYQVEAQAEPLVSSFNHLFKEADTRIRILAGLAELGAGPKPDFELDIPGIVNRFSGVREEDLPF